MKAHVRAAAAAIALSHSLEKTISSVFDHSAGQHFIIQVSISNENVNAYDHRNGCHITGKIPGLFHYGENSHLQLRPSGDQYSGYDYGSGSHFTVNVSNKQATVYDYKESKHFIYSA